MFLRLLKLKTDGQKSYKDKTSLRRCKSEIKYSLVMG